MKRKVFFCCVISILSPILAHYADMLLIRLYFKIDPAIFGLADSGGWMASSSVSAWVLVINFLLTVYLVGVFMKMGGGLKHVIKRVNLEEYPVEGGQSK
ncbi:MAG: hypothetical protein Q4C55_08735 [Eubacterium sp.]|nr:hypothetical protein [Eubacterium sp.]